MIIETANLERVFELSCGGNLQPKFRLLIRDLAINLLYSVAYQKHKKPIDKFKDSYKALFKFKTNLQRRKNASDTLTSSRLMEVPEPARAILIAEIAYTFRDEINDYTQIDFGNDEHVKLLKVAVDSSISKIADKQGRPVNEPLDEFFIGLRDLYEAATGKKATAEARYSNKPKTDFEQLIYLGYQIIRPAQNYDAAYKAYERAISRNSQTTE